MQCVASPAVPGMPAPFGVQGSGTVYGGLDNVGANIYPKVSDVPRWHWQDPRSAGVLTNIPPESVVQFGQRDNRLGLDACAVYSNPYAGWGACYDFTGTDYLREIPQGGSWVGGVGTSMTPWVAPNASGGDNLPPGGCPPGTSPVPGRGCF